MTDNELIAEFMGGKLCDYPDGIFDAKGYYCHKGVWWNRNNLEYHSSWDWIMPVWIKFRNLEFEEHSALEHKHESWITNLQWYLFSSDEPKRFAERMTYAIKWYNEKEATPTP